MLHCVYFGGDATQKSRDLESASALLTKCEVNMAGNRPSTFFLYLYWIAYREAHDVQDHTKEKEANIQPY